MPYGGSASHLLVAAKQGDEPVVCIVPRSQAGIRGTDLATTGWDKQQNISLGQVAVGAGDILGDSGEAVLESALTMGAAMQCLVLCGMAQRVLEMTLDYAKIRVQFGRPIGSFQAVQHHLANMAVDADTSRTVSYQLAQRITSGEPHRFEASAAKAYVATACNRVLSTGHQVHGGIGVISDHPMQRYFLRAKPLETLLGDIAFHTRRVSDALPDLTQA